MFYMYFSNTNIIVIKIKLAVTAYYLKTAWEEPAVSFGQLRQWSLINQFKL